MSFPLALVLDANILIRGSLGYRVRSLLRKYENNISFYTLEICLDDAHRHVLDLAAERNLDPTKPFANLDELNGMITAVSAAEYAPFESAARPRITARDEHDWPIVAAALLLNCPIWTEDQDFFGCGIATWTSDRVELYLNAA